MSTRAQIIVEIPSNLIGHYSKFDKSLLPKEIGDFDGKCGEDGFIHGVPKKIMNKKFLYKKRYISIYHHWDGYPERLGKELRRKYKTIEQILNLISIGDVSTILGDKIVPYCVRNDDWNEIKPLQVDEFEDIPLKQYNYLFSNGKWKTIKGY